MSRASQVPAAAKMLALERLQGKAGLAGCSYLPRTTVNFGSRLLCLVPMPSCIRAASREQLLHSSFPCPAMLPASGRQGPEQTRDPESESSRYWWNFT